MAVTLPLVIIPVFDPVSLKLVLTPIQSRFEGLTFPTPTFPDVTREFTEFVNWTVFDVVFPYPTTVLSGKMTWDDVMLVMRPEVSTVILGV